MLPSLTVLIPTHGRPTLLARTLRSVAACDRPPGYDGCVVVENGPPAGAEAIVAEVAAEHPDAGLCYLHHAQANKSAALNAAMADLPDDRLVVFFDDDVRVEPQVLRAYAEAAAQAPGHYYGGPVGCDYEQVPPDWLLPLLPYSAVGFTIEQARRAGYFLGANWAASAGDLRRVGGFDPNYGPGSPTGARGQEKNMQLRLRAGGAELVPVSPAMIHHHVPRDRCSPEWAIQRQHQMGMQQGLLARSDARFRLLALALRRIPLRVLSVAKRRLLRDRTGYQASFASLTKEVGVVRGYLSRPSSIES